MTTDEALDAARQAANEGLRGYYPAACLALAAEVRRLRRGQLVGEGEAPLQFAAGAKVPGEVTTKQTASKRAGEIIYRRNVSSFLGWKAA